MWGVSTDKRSCQWHPYVGVWYGVLWRGVVVEVEVGLVRDGGVGVVTPVVARVAGMFGLGVDERRRVVVVPRVRVRLGGGWVVFVTGASGGGKSSLLGLLAGELSGRAGVRVVRFRGGAVGGDGGGGGTVVDRLCGLGFGLEEVLGVLGVAGLNDAFVMLRRVEELSEGQRYRYGLAEGMLRLGGGCGEGEGGGGGLTVVLADEFGSGLDRVTAKVLARRVRRWVSGRGDVCFVAATSHDDLLESIGADVLVELGLGGRLEVVYREGLGEGVG